MSNEERFDRATRWTETELRDLATMRGMEAYAKGRASCPFKDGTQSAIWWQQGYDMAKQRHPQIECHGLDTPERVCFYEQDFYALSNFSAFQVRYCGVDYQTSEHAYQAQKFIDGGMESRTMAVVFDRIRTARSAHDAFKLAEEYAHLRRVDWGHVKLHVMRAILYAKVQQHEYVRRKLLATGDRELVENSWRDDFWGWGPNRDGQNWLGRLWMEVRADLRSEIRSIVEEKQEDV